MTSHQQAFQELFVTSFPSDLHGDKITPKNKPASCNSSTHLVRFAIFWLVSDGSLQVMVSGNWLVESTSQCDRTCLITGAVCMCVCVSVCVWVYDSPIGGIRFTEGRKCRRVEPGEGINCQSTRLKCRGLALSSKTPSSSPVNTVNTKTASARCTHMGNEWNTHTG